MAELFQNAPAPAGAHAATQSAWRKYLPIAGIALLAVVLILAALAATSHIDISLEGEDTVTLTNREPYEEPGASAQFSSVVFGDGHGLGKVNVKCTGDVDDTEPGEYELTYSARFLLWSAETKRYVIVEDTAAPEITLTESTDEYLPLGTDFEEPGFDAVDDYDGDVAGKVEVTGSVDSSTPGTYELTYTATDGAGNSSQVTRTVEVRDMTAPTITLEGDESINVFQDTTFEDPGYSASDDYDGDITDSVEITGKVDIATPGDYTITYTATDAAGNSSQVTRTVTVKPVLKQGNVTDVPDHKVVYLTFDDGPGDYTQELLDILARHNVKATFFVTGNGDASLIAKEAQAGHSIGVHTYTHDYNTIYASEAAFFADYEKMQSVIEQQTGSRTTLMRFPGGSSNTVSDFNPGIMTRLTASVTAQGYQYFDWNVSSGDAGGTTDKDKVVENVIEGMKSHDVSVVLQHDIKDFSVEATEEIIVWGLENGYTFLPLSSSSPTAHHGVNN